MTSHNPTDPPQQPAGGDQPAVEAFWRSLLTRGHPGVQGGSKLMQFLPANPRCQQCRAPFGGLGGRLLSLTGRRPSRKNPNLCNV